MANVTPVALWQLNETSGTIANDSIGNNDGILKNNPTWTAGQVNGALSFDGVNDYVQVADNNALDFGTGDFSISTWVKTTDSSGIDVLLDKRVEASGPVQGYVLYNYNGKLGFQLADGVGSGWTNYVSNVSITDGNWHQVTVTIDRDSTTGGKWYVDGVQVGTFNPTGRQGSLSNSKPLTIGRRSDSSWAGYFKGSLDEVQLFNKSLSASEVSSLFNQPSFTGDDFDPDIDSLQWETIDNGSANNQFVGSTGDSLFFTGSGTRQAVTNFADFSSGNILRFDIIFGNSRNGGENADAGEDVLLEYSTNGSNWNVINTYDTEDFTVFTSITELIPRTAITDTTQFRWRQVSHSGSNFDQWAIDNVSLGGFIRDDSIDLINTTIPSGEAALI